MSISAHDLPPAGIGATAAEQISTVQRQYWLRWTLAAAMALPALLFGLIASHDHGRVLAEGVADAQRTTATLREHALKVLETHDLLIQQVERRVQGMGWDEIEASSLGQELAAVQAAHPQIALIGLADAAGQLRVSSRALPAGGINVSAREFWTVQRERDAGTYISRPFTPHASTEPGFGLSRRRTTPDGRFDGTVHVVVSVA